MEHCQYVDDSHSFVDGYWCSYLNQHIEWRNTRGYCNSEMGSERCPFLNGIPILTDEIGSQIADAFHQCVTEAKEGMNRMAQEVSSIATQTSMESIQNVCMAIRNGRISVPGVSGLFKDQLHLRSEEDVAAKVESEISNDIYELGNPVAYAPSVSGDTVISSDDFSRLCCAIQTYGAQATEAMTRYSSGLSGSEETFDEPVKSLAMQCSAKLNAQIQRIYAEASNAAQTFETGVSESLAAAGSGYNVLSFANVNWDFEWI